MDNRSQLSKEERSAILTQQAEMIRFLQQQGAALQKEIETLKRGGKGRPDRSEIAVSQSRFGQQAHALVAYLRQVGAGPFAPLPPCFPRGALSK